MEQRNQERPSFAGLIADISNANGRWRNAQLKPRKPRFATGSIKANGYSSKPDFLFTVEDGKHHKFGACAIEHYVQQEGLRPLTDS